MLPRELIKKIKRIEIYTNRLVTDQLAGQYVSVFKGRGMAFEEVRQYMPGDDVRIIDWNVSARMNDVYVKLFVEEREMTVILLVDLSASGRFGTVTDSKQEVMAELAAAVAFSAIRNNDRVGLILFTDRIEKYVPPKKGRKHVLRVVMEILNAKPKGRGTDIGVALDYLGKVTRHRAVVFLVSDFIASGYEQGIRVASAKHDLIPLVVTDPKEESLPRLGTALVEDLETGEVVLLDTEDRRVRRDYEHRIQSLRSERERFWRRLRMDFVNIRTDAPEGHYEQPLVKFFRLRAKRARRGGVA
jgi:uncharacterized protein (DUF58 family)